MDISGPGTAIMVAVAAVLWFAYLVPTWFRRREYLATERNATRLGQTLRIMAETAEVPEAVRVEATARDAAHQERLLRERARQRVSRERADLARVRAEAAPTVRRAEERRRRVRRSRLVAFGLVVAAMVVVSVQAVLVATTGTATGSWFVLGGAGVVGAAALGTLRRLAAVRIAAPRVTVGVASRTAQELRDFAVASAASAPETSAVGWTPVAVPKPLYLSRTVAARATMDPDAERRLRDASLAAERALRAAHAEPEVAVFPTAAARAVSEHLVANARLATTTALATGAASSTTAAPSRIGRGSDSRPFPGTREPDQPAAAREPSRWAGMGIVDDVARGVPDLDEVLRRRRAG